jgi:protein-tyrosine phosphatase
MIDFHSHILPALDDGAVTIDDSIAMAKELAEFGYRTVCCTPHCIKGYYELTPQRVREATLMLQADLDNADIHLELWPGMEYMLDEFFAEYADDLQSLGETRLILCEAPPKAHPDVVREGLVLILEKGFVPLIAHPERTRHFYAMLSSLDAGQRPADEEDFHGTRPMEQDFLKTGARNFIQKFWPFAARAPRPVNPPLSVPQSNLPEPCLFQANLGGFTGYYGETVQRQAYELLKLGVYTALGSDLHDYGAVAKILIDDKVDTNPLLQRLAAFDGSTNSLPKTRGIPGGGGQGELF